MKAHRLFLLVILTTSIVIPALLPRAMVDLLVFAGIYAIAGLGVGLLLGQCGIANLGQTVFYGIGAYATAYLTVQMGAPSIVGFLAGVCISALIAITVGWPILRLTGYFLALATLALGIIANALFYEWEWLTGGTLGIGGVPKLGLTAFRFDTPLRFYYLVLAVLLVSVILANNMVNSRTGLMLRAMRDAPDAAKSLAINIQWLRTSTFVVSAILGSVAGSLFAHYGGYVNVQSFGIERTITFLLIPVLGGATSLPGLIIGALFIAFLPDLLSHFGDIHQILFGMALVTVVVFMPAGLSDALARLWCRLSKKCMDAKL